MTAAVPHFRLAYLDSVRGIAASFVVAYHCALAVGAQKALQSFRWPQTAAGSFAEFVLHRVAGFLDLGRAAVMVFFVLSGFVLAGSLLNTPSTYARFAMKRLFRIYPAFLVVIAVSYVLHRCIGASLPAGSVLMNRISTPDLSLLQLFKALTLWGTAPSLNLDLVTWSLVHELRVSLLFPLILLSVRRAPSAALPGYAILSVACTLWLRAATETWPTLR